MTTQPVEEAKKWYASRIIILNILAVVAIVVSGIAGRDILTPELQASIATVVLAVVNIVLRVRTNTKITK